MAKMNFTEAQNRALDLSSGKLVLAGAGSGKTTVMTERYVRMLEDPSIEPHSLVALTFSRKAAANLKQKIHSSLLDREKFDLKNSAIWQKQREKMVWARVGTIHSFCGKLLRSYPLEAGVDPDFRIVDSNQTDISQHVNESISRMARKFDPDLRELMNYVTFKNDIETLLHLALTDPIVNLAIKATSKDSSNAEIYLTEQYKKLLDIYDSDYNPSECDHTNYLETIRLLGNVLLKVEQNKPETRSLLCYDDLEILALSLLKNNNLVLEEVRKSIKALMVDEFQDTSKVQWELIKLLGSKSNGKLDIDKVFFVGDEKQSIYSFRNADVTVVRKAEKEFQAIENNKERWSVNLRDNFRSVASVLNSLNDIFENVFAPQNVDYLEFEARPGELESGRKDAGPLETVVELGLLLGEDEKSLADLVAQRISLAVEKGTLTASENGVMRKLRYGDIGILIRQWSKLEAIEEALAAEKIPYNVVGGGEYFEEQEILDLMNLIATLADSRDKIAFTGLLRGPIFSISDNVVALLYRENQNPIEVWDKLANRDPSFAGILESLSENEFQSIKGGWTLWQGIIKTSLKNTISELLYYVLNQSGAWAVYAMGKKGDKALSNIFQFIDIICDQVNDGYSSFRQLHERLKQLKESGDSEISPEYKSSSPDSVTVMTVHKSKGLEFPFVIMPDISSDFRFNRGIGELQRGNLMVEDSPFKGLTHNRFGIVNESLSKNSGTIHNLMKELTSPAEEMAEKKRLLYVATTRARDHLLMLGHIKDLKKYNKAIGAGKINNPIAMFSKALRFQIGENQELVCDPNSGIDVKLLKKAEIVTKEGKKYPTLQEKGVKIPEEVFDPSVLLHNAPNPENWMIPITAFASYIAKSTDENIRQLVWYMSEDSEKSEKSEIKTDFDYSENIPGSGIQVGNVLHEIYERFGPGCSWETTKDFVEEIVGAAENGDSENGDIIDRVKTQILNGQEIDFYKTSEKSYREIPLLMQLGGIKLRGRIDIVWRDGEQVIAGDYKTNDLSGVDAARFATEKGYDIQAKLYALALAKAWNLKSVKSELIFLSTKEKVHYEVKVEDEEKYLIHATALIAHWNRLVKENEEQI
jgi:ATP-dependent exoDNAse (exonuclease V) beta subunit